MRSPSHGVMSAEKVRAKVGVALMPSTITALQIIAVRRGLVKKRKVKKGEKDKGRGHASVAALIVESYAQGKYFCSCGAIHALPECHQEGK